MRRTPLVLVAGLAALLAAGCSTGSPASAGAGSAASSAPAGGSAAAARDVRGSITVLAAASLKDTFGELAKQFEAAHPGTTVTLSFGASSALAAQITSGAPADVFAAASTKTMQTVVDAGAASDPTVFATNVMEIAVPAADPAGVTTLADLAKPAVKVALCQAQVPCGVAAGKVLANASIAVTPVTLEPDVKAVLSKVSLGEVDAGIVYVTDVRSAGDRVRGVPIPADVNASTAYPIVTLAAAPNPATARAFVDYVRSSDGRAVLAAAGFGAP